MGKPTIEPAQRRASAKRSIERGAFVLGRRAFAKISAVEGISLSAFLDADLRELEWASSTARRRVLAAKYAKA